MKKWHFLSGAFIAAFTVFLACGDDKALTITDSVHMDEHGDPDIQERLGCIDYDSVTFSDGSYAVWELKRAPMNRLTRYVDTEGRWIATISGASEVSDQYLVYNYDSAGRLTHFLRFDEKLYSDEFGEFEGKEGDTYLDFRLAIDNIDFDRPDTTRHIVSRVVYDDDGYAREVFEVPTGKRIKAPEGYKLEVYVDPCVSFWASDLDGGRFLLKVDMVPLASTDGTYFVKRFVDFMPTIDEYYEGGQRSKIVCHPNPSFTDDAGTIKTRSVENGAHIYVTKYEGNSDTWVHVWKDGRLREERRESRYGTTLEAERYSYPASGKVKVESLRYDYRAKRLKPVSVEIKERSDMRSEAEEMNPLRVSLWENEYDSLKYSE